MPSAKSKSKQVDSCPVCATQRQTYSEVTGKDTWVGCEKCERWFHWRCVAPNPTDTLDLVDHWFCQQCIEESNGALSVAYRPAPRKSSRSSNTSKINFQNLVNGVGHDPDYWYNIIQTKKLHDGNAEFPPHDPASLNDEWLFNSPDSMTDPVIIERPEGLDMKMPKEDITIDEITDLVGPNTPLEVMDVASQLGLSNWTLSRWASYWNDPKRDKILNVISLEVSQSPVGEMMSPPAFVRRLDWLESVWPSYKREQLVYPKVQKYCLMSVARSWTDWHVDFSASSVYYHILRGAKVFYFIRPTHANLKKYEQWSGSAGRQEHTWLGDIVDKVYEVKLTKGNTMIIPSGWIHAVYTPEDSLVMGGNFLHSLNIPAQIQLYHIELATKVPKRFRYPLFITLLWYVGKVYVDRLSKIVPKIQEQLQQEQPKQKQPNNLDIPIDLTPRVLRGLANLSVFLLEQARRTTAPTSSSSHQNKKPQSPPPPTDVVAGTENNGTEKSHSHSKPKQQTQNDDTITPEKKRAARENVPWDDVPEPGQTATNLRKLSLKMIGMLNALSRRGMKGGKEFDSSVPSLKRKTSTSSMSPVESLPSLSSLSPHTKSPIPETVPDSKTKKEEIEQPPLKSIRTA